MKRPAIWPEVGVLLILAVIAFLAGSCGGEDRGNDTPVPQGLTERFATGPPVSPHDRAQEALRGSRSAEDRPDLDDLGPGWLSRSAERTSPDPLRQALAFHRQMASYEGPKPEPPQRTSPLDWEALAECESGGDPTINTGNGYFGLYQFDLTTWQGVGGTGLPSEASAAEQTARAQALYADRGAAPWPTCGRLL